MVIDPRKPKLNIGVVGHVDHGKSTLVKALTGVWTARHSEEIKRGMTIKLGFASAQFYRCPNCGTYGTTPKCKVCGSDTQFIRSVSFVDSPGHEVLMARMLSGAAVMDGAMLVIAANEPCPQPQTREHFTALEIMGVKKLVIVQNKVDVVSKEKALENYKEIKQMIAGTWAEGSPIIPVSALREINISALIKALVETIPVPQRDLTKPFQMYVIRSFDINKPGTTPDEFHGGVLGGSILTGLLKLGDEVEILPGVKSNGKYTPLTASVRGLKSDSIELTEADPGGLIGVETDLDPSLTKADNLVGSVVGMIGTLPQPTSEVSIEAHVFQRVIGTKEMATLGPLKPGEQIVLAIGPAIVSGVVKSFKSGQLDVKLNRPVVATTGGRVAIARKVFEKWRLTGYGTLK
ncbi:translation initiation factor IF-2 subunit gamma [Candidatus Marsarchaeota G2 archaeon ECH_B_SAG-G16]|jgi:translation initiation factor 2 subunit gamma (aeIF-2g)|uniref:protein-synthesizing GTPase n=3 Tax=Candidatus Marsarchaeota TaxID=1978152 RepID=A0A2R6ATN4_9ARCH|nr:MAG: translation initiation factor IF-2 subunit gamma [Candidatus Marsarchaeota G1 archaeon OSP_C]PSO03810.1 MAG: translation initiation factor IF-2 subunit gamma [Candidatus Marsarchaeota G2 archaeon ECH_B_SAG-G16]